VVNVDGNPYYWGNLGMNRENKHRSAARGSKLQLKSEYLGLVKVHRCRKTYWVPGIAGTAWQHPILRQAPYLSCRIRCFGAFWWLGNHFVSCVI